MEPCGARVNSIVCAWAVFKYGKNVAKQHKNELYNNNDEIRMIMLNETYEIKKMKYMLRLTNKLIQLCSSSGVNRSNGITAMIK